MSLDKFFLVSPAEAWKKMQQEEEEKRRRTEEEERQRRIEELKARGEKRTASPLPPPPASPSPPPLASSTDFHIENLPDRYRMHQVQYNNGVYVVDWSKELLDQGVSNVQQEWIEATQSTKWKIPNLQLYHATLRALYQHREHPVKEQKEVVEELRQVFKADFTPAKPYMMTSTRIKYTTDDKDIVTHDVGYVTARKLTVSLVGPNGLINASSGLEKQMDALLGSRDVAEIETVYEWMNDKKPYLYRFTQKPARDEERAAVLGCDVDGFGINNFIIDVGPFRGVVALAQKK